MCKQSVKTNLNSMNAKLLNLMALFLGLTWLAAAPAQAQQHRATGLGSPATRFAKPLETPDDLRNMLRSEALRGDVNFMVLRCGYQGDLADLHRAAATAPITELKIPVGTRLPAMASRKNGKAVLLLDVLWAGEAPIDAYEFFFTSNGRRYRLVAPRACSNFWVEDKGKELRPALALECDAPGEVSLHRPAQVCLTVKNTGDGAEPLAQVTMPTPAGATLVSTTGGGKVLEAAVLWELPNLAAGESRRVCATFTLPQPGVLAFAATAHGNLSPATESRCETRVAGVPAILFEKSDDPDPIQIGETTTYTVKITNQGTADDSNVRMVLSFPPEVTPVSAAGGTVEGQTVSFPTVPHLEPKYAVTYKVVAKGVQAGDAHVRFTLTSDALKSPLLAEESTHVFER
jgi:uncharacterized repeat protein (TIGR01451 family)